MTQTAILDIQDGCNLACVFCLEDDAARPELANPTAPAVTAQLADLRQRGAQHITFMGGETFFRKDLGAIIGDARRLGFTRIGVTTNGTILAKADYLRRQVEAGLDFIEFSLHGHTAEVANAIARRPYAFARQATALAHIDALALPTIFNVVICEENQNHLLDIARYVVESFPHIPAQFKFKFVSLIGRAGSEARKLGKALRYEDVDITPVGDYLALHNIGVWFGNFPLCRLGEHAASSHELSVMAADEQFFDLFRKENEYKATGYQLGNRVRPENSCGVCTLRAICPGIERNYIGFGADRALSTRQDAPLPLLESALRRRLLDPALAPRRLAMLAARADAVLAPATAPSAPGLLVSHPTAPHPLRLQVAPRDDGKPAYVKTKRFALSYVAWLDDDAYLCPEVAVLLAAAARTLNLVDDAGGEIAAASAGLVQAAATCGWQAVV